MRDMAKVHGNKKEKQQNTMPMVVYPLPHLQWRYNFTTVILCFIL